MIGKRVRERGKKWRREAGDVPPPPGSLYDYQRKRAVGEGICMNIKTREIEFGRAVLKGRR